MPLPSLRLGGSCPLWNVYEAFAQPGRVLTQTRNPGELIDWLTVELPFTRES